MIFPHPESNFSLNLMVLGSDIVKILKLQKDFVLIEKILNIFLQKEEKRTPEMFLNALSFLFAMGLIEKKNYRIKLISRN
jgi:hypothetical protein